MTNVGLATARSHAVAVGQVDKIGVKCFAQQFGQSLLGVDAAVEILCRQPLGRNRLGLLRLVQSNLLNEASRPGDPGPFGGVSSANRWRHCR